MSITLEEAKKLTECQELLYSQGGLVAVVAPTGAIYRDSCVVKIKKIYTKDPEEQVVTGGLIVANYKNLEIISMDQKKQH